MGNWDRKTGAGGSESGDLYENGNPTTFTRRKDLAVGGEESASANDGGQEDRTTLTPDEAKNMDREARSEMKTLTDEKGHLPPAPIPSTPPGRADKTDRPNDSGGHYFQNIYDEHSGEAPKMRLCLGVLQMVTQALSQREFIASKSFSGGVFLMPFPVIDKDSVARMEIYGFDNGEPYSRLEEITHNLYDLISFKEANSMGTLDRDGRINLIKALTVYFADLIGQNPEGLGVNYKLAIESMNRMNWSLVTAPGATTTTRFFNVGREDEVIIGKDELKEFKMMLSRFFLDKLKKSRDAEEQAPKVMTENNAGAKRVNGFPARTGIRTLSDAARDQANAVIGSADTLIGDTPALVEGDRHLHNLEAARKARRLRDISASMLKLLKPTGGALDDPMTALTIVGDLLLDEELGLEQCCALYRIDKGQAKLLQAKMRDARKDIAGLNLSKNQIYSVMLQFLSGKAQGVSPEILRILVSTELE